MREKIIDDLLLSLGAAKNAYTLAVNGGFESEASYTLEAMGYLKDALYRAQRCKPLAANAAVELPEVKVFCQGHPDSIGE